MPSFERILKAARNIARTREAQSRIDNMGYSHDYAEPGYSVTNPDKGIVFSNWNDITKYDSDTKQHTLLDSAMSRLGDTLTKAGFDIEWEDEWTTCSDCGKAVRTQPDSHFWTPAYTTAYIADGELICNECAKAKEPA